MEAARQTDRQKGRQTDRPSSSMSYLQHNHDGIEEVMDLGTHHGFNVTRFSYLPKQ